MSGKIFVPLGKRDRIEEIIPYLDVLARPGMQVVFLTPYREKVSWMEVQLTAMQTGTKAITTTAALAANASREAHFTVGRTADSSGPWGITKEEYNRRC